MGKRKRRTFTEEFKADAVRLCKAGGQSMGEVARRLDLTETSLRAWVRQAEIDAGKGTPEALTTVEREELSVTGSRHPGIMRAAPGLDLAGRCHDPIGTASSCRLRWSHQAPACCAR